MQQVETSHLRLSAVQVATVSLTVVLLISLILCHAHLAPSALRSLFGFYSLKFSSDVERIALEIKLPSLDVNSKEEYRRLYPGLNYADAAPTDPSVSIKWHRLGDLLSAWHPDDMSPSNWVNSAAHPSHDNNASAPGVMELQSLPRFNYLDIAQRKLALARRNLELPFVVYNVPALDAAAAATANPTSMISSGVLLAARTDSGETMAGARGAFSKVGLVHNMGFQPRRVERSSSNKFMYYTLQQQQKQKMKQKLKQRPSGELAYQEAASAGSPERLRRREGWEQRVESANEVQQQWQPPQTDVQMRFPDFLREAMRAELPPTSPAPSGDSDSSLDSISPNASMVNSSKPLYYLTMSSMESDKMDWVAAALPFFSPNPSLFIADTSSYRGVVCRLGMRGVVAAAHFDGRRNFVAVIRGRRRYILLPPEECPNLHLLPRGHPSARHSAVDWADIEQVRSRPRIYNAKATEVVLSMGELLYIPSYWFHYIVSQDATVQCNCRSGDSPIGRSQIARCGFIKGAK